MFLLLSIAAEGKRYGKKMASVIYNVSYLKTKQNKIVLFYPGTNSNDRKESTTVQITFKDFNKFLLVISEFTIPLIGNDAANTSE